ncbi:hypothetical protein WJX72_002129 [[Myrmecia] bisecta]|uniref:RING-type E3 ubiquitin transferase n=1 Tax=[Myrmecia] bisecta TaxID=41462 RepID=A0AAW1PWE2_9CHLO
MMAGNADELRKKIMAIQMDASLSDAEKAVKRQELMSGAWKQPQKTEDADEDKGKGKAPAAPQQPTAFDESLKCAMCMELAVRPITAPCQHNFCLGCFNKWTAQGKKTCPTCRAGFPAKFAANPRINTVLASAIRLAKQGEQRAGPAKTFSRINDKDRPDEAYVTDRAVRAGRANASSGRIMVNVPGDHFGPIPAEADPRGQGIRVGEFWKDRLDCRQWGAHFPHVAGIAGQSHVGAQSVVLSGGYEDDRDEGEWFLYTGSGGRDLSGNKRTNKVQSFDQKYENMNKALLLSCQKGLPVRVVRSFKEKRSAYAPTDEQPVRYDGIYRIARSWRKPGAQGFLVCRYLFIRADNEPAPWSSEEEGDKAWDGKLPKDALADMKDASGKITEMGADPWWEWNAEKGEWGWSRPPPLSAKLGGGGEANTPKKLRKKVNEHERALREFACRLCSATLQQPVSTPCGHHFCLDCLKKKFEGMGDIQEPRVETSRSMRVRKVVKPCPTCKADLADFTGAMQVNRDMQAIIERLQEAAQKAEAAAQKAEQAGADAQAEGEADGEEEADVDAEVEEADPAGDADVASGSGTLAAAADVASGSSSGAQENQAGDANGAKLAAAVEPAKPAAAPKAAPPAPTVAGAPAAEVEALYSEFPEFDAVLIRGMVEDQGGDIPEVHACLRRMRRQQVAADSKAKKAASATVKEPAAAKKAATAKEAKPGTAKSSKGKGKKRAAEEGPSKEATASKQPKA